MPLEVSIDGGKRDFEPVTEMIQPGVLADIVDKGQLPDFYNPGKTKHKCMFVWILAEEDSEGRNKRVFETFTVSLNEKASLRKRVKDLRGKDVEKGEKFILDSLIGTKRMLVLSAEDSKDGGKPFIKVQATMPLKKTGPQAPDIPADFVRKQDQTK